MSNKKGFILHKDSLIILDEMTDEQAGKFFKIIYQYQLNGSVPELDFAMKMAIMPFINQFKRDGESYQKICERNRNSGSKGGKQKLANASERYRLQTNLADSDSDSDSKKEKNKINNKKDGGEEKKKINLAFAECLQVIEIAKSFDEYSPAYIFENKTTNAVVLGMGGIQGISKATIDSYWKHDFKETWKLYKQTNKASTKASGNLRKKTGKFKYIRENDPAYGREEILIDNEIEKVPEAKI